jgi:hypothetical protein
MIAWPRSGDITKKPEGSLIVGNLLNVVRQDQNWSNTIVIICINEISGSVLSFQYLVLDF